jgi:hypothetical protein
LAIKREDKIMATSDRGLGSDNMDEKTKHDIQSKGGQASHGSQSGSSSKSTSSSGAISNRSGGGRLTKKDQSKGGKH